MPEDDPHAVASNMQRMRDPYDTALKAALIRGMDQARDGKVTERSFLEVADED